PITDLLRQLTPEGILRRGRKILDLDDAGLRDRPATYRPLKGKARILYGCADRAVVGSLHDFIAVGEDKIRVEGIAQPGCGAHDRIEDELDVDRRTRDDAKDLGRGRLLFLRLRLALQTLRQALL